jgi:hypothetical protein
MDLNTPVDEYLERQEMFNLCIKDTERYIKWLKTRTGLARHKARNKIVSVRKALVMLEWMKDEDSLPWEPGPTYSRDEFPATALLRSARITT